MYARIYVQKVFGFDAVLFPFGVVKTFAVAAS